MIVLDECYLEFWFDIVFVGLFEVCVEIGWDDYKNCVVFYLLFKCLNLLGMCFGFVVGDVVLFKFYL